MTIPFSVVSYFASEFGAVDCFWQRCDSSPTGYRAVVKFDSLPSGFCRRWAAEFGCTVAVQPLVCRDGVVFQPGRFVVVLSGVGPDCGVRLSGQCGLIR